MKQLYEQIAEGREVRKALIRIKAAIKDEKQQTLLQKLYETESEVLINCLLHEDAKVRKNAAAVLGTLKDDKIPELLLEAYKKETQLFVKSDYVKAIGAFDCAPYLSIFKERIDELEKLIPAKTKEAEQNKEKHLREELKALRELVFRYERPKMHVFTGYQELVDIVLLTNRGQEKLTADQIVSTEQKEKKKADEDMSAGRIRLGKGLVLAEHVKAEPLLSIRTYRERLFCLPDREKVERPNMAEQLLKRGLLELLDRLHEPGEAFYFRIDVKGSMDLKARSQFCEHLAKELEDLSGGRLKNMPSAYELEIRLAEGRDGSFKPFLKLRTLPDKRFSYRKYHVAASIAPSQAAICMELAAPYLKEQAQILDPFCGTGAMLLERNYKLHANTLYGVDIYGPAISGARANAEIAGVPAHFINRDALGFTHEYLFDEIVTNFPRAGKTMDAHSIDCLYGQFLERAKSWLKPEGIILLYSHDRGYVKKQVRQSGTWKIQEEWCVSEQEGAYLFCITKR